MPRRSPPSYCCSSFAEYPVLFWWDVLGTGVIRYFSEMMRTSCHSRLTTFQQTNMVLKSIRFQKEIHLHYLQMVNFLLQSSTIQDATKQYFWIWTATTRWLGNSTFARPLVCGCLRVQALAHCQVIYRSQVSPRIVQNYARIQPTKHVRKSKKQTWY